MHARARHDAAGFPVPEAHIMGNHAVALGVARADIYPEVIPNCVPAGGGGTITSRQLMACLACSAGAGGDERL